MNTTATIREEGGQLVGAYTLDDAPNDFIRELVREALANGTASARDPEGCEVSAVAEGTA